MWGECGVACASCAFVRMPRQGGPASRLRLIYALPPPVCGSSYRCPQTQARTWPSFLLSVSVAFHSLPLLWQHWGHDSLSFSIYLLQRTLQALVWSRWLPKKSPQKWPIPDSGGLTARCNKTRLALTHSYPSTSRHSPWGTSTLTQSTRPGQVKPSHYPHFQRHFCSLYQVISKIAATKVRTSLLIFAATYTRPA